MTNQQTALPLAPPPPPREKPRPLKVSGKTQAARQASADGAQLNAAANRDDQIARLSAFLEEQGYRGATDAEIGRDLKWPSNIVTARRNDLVADGLVVARWPESRRTSITSTVKVTVWVWAPAVRVLAAIKQQQSTGGGACANADRYHGNDAEPERTGSPLEVVTSPGGENPAAPAIDETASAPSAPQRLTRETVRSVAFSTRVVLADGRLAQLRMVTTKGEAVLFIFKTRALETVDPARLIDRRETDGELVEINA